LATKELAVASRQASPHTFFSIRELLTKNKMTAVPHPPYFFVFPSEDKIERPPF
jgi:hypothetical protein